MSLEIILRSGLSTGTILLFAAIGEILTELAGIQNLGVEGMMLLGAMAAFRRAWRRGSPWMGLLAASGRRICSARSRTSDHPLPGRPVSALSLTFSGRAGACAGEG